MIGWKGTTEGGVRIAYVAVSTPFRRNSWSGIPWYSHRELLRRFPDTHVIDTPLLDSVTQGLSTFEQFGFSVRRHHLVAHQYSRLIDRQLEKLKPDVVVAVAAAHKIAYIDPKWPVIYVADAMYATVIDYYGKYAGLGHQSRVQGNAVQRSLLDRVDRVLLGSRWAADAARLAYDLPEDLLRVVPMGANLDEDPGAQPPATFGPLRLLFVGFDWERKGGELVLEIWRELRRRTGTAELNIVGARPKAAMGLDGVYLHGRIDKADRDDYERLTALYRRSSFFIMPSRQEAFGIVYCEAAAFGRPSIAADTGGVASIIEDGHSGLLLPLEASAADYADRILAAWSNPEAHQRLCRGARHAYEMRLNWSCWGDAVTDAIGEVLADPAPRPL
jgi:glycosyltransferase involved in cell wall biosynthesis